MFWDKMGLMSDGNVLFNILNNYNFAYLKMLSKTNLDNVLKNNGIYSRLKSTAIIVTNWGGNVYPHIIWIRTQDDKNYYMASDYYFSFEWDKNWMSEVYNNNWNNQKVMNQDEFNKIYLWNEGTLSFDNNIITDKFKPIFHMENKKDLDLLLNNDIESKQLYSTYEWTFREGKFYMSPHGCLSFLGKCFW